MTFDFSALLVVLTFGSGLIWAVDSWLLAPRRTSPVGAAAQPAGADRRGEPWLVEYARSFFPVFLIVLVLRSFVVEPFRIPSASMMPTLLIGDFILVNKYDFGIRLPVINIKILENGAPGRGDIVVFRYPENPSIPYIKRVIGVPGDTFEYRDKRVYINGVGMAQEPMGHYDGQGAGRIMDGARRQRELLGEVSHEILVDPQLPGFDTRAVIPEGHYFVLGDNRDNSKDSRVWGFVPDQNLIGRAFMIWMNWDTKNGGIAWKRIGTILQ